jgi:DNA-binding protein HU-beta
MTKAELISQIAGAVQLPAYKAQRTVKILVDAIRQEVNIGRHVTLHGLGTFRAKRRKARTGRDPRTGAPIVIWSGRKISFKPSKSLKALINR